MQVAMSLRRSVRNVDTAARLGGDEPPVTLSIGVVSSPEHGDDPEATDGIEVAEEAKSWRLAATR
jgi:GGDEF domain-containing protein